MNLFYIIKKVLSNHNKMNTMNEQSNLFALKDINSIPIHKKQNNVHVHEAIKSCARIVSKMPKSFCICVSLVSTVKPV